MNRRSCYGRRKRVFFEMSSCREKFKARNEMRMLEIRIPQLRHCSVELDILYMS